MTAVSDRIASGASTGEDPGSSLTGGRLGAIGRLLFPIGLALLIFAHGCHTGDHDDEPSFGQPIQEMEPPR